MNNHDEKEEKRLDQEIEIVQKMKQAFATSLLMLETARDDIVEMGKRMDRLRAASEACRKALAEKKQKEDRGSEMKSTS